MAWYVLAKSEGDSEAVSTKLKGIIRDSAFFQKLFEEYGVPLDKLDNLVFKVKKMKGKYATSNSKEIWLNEKLFRDGTFFDDKVHYVVHEMIHWLTRQREKQLYFTDPEEVEAFIHSIRWELLRGKSRERILEDFFPIIGAHFDNERDAVSLFDEFFEKACRLNNT